MRKLMLSTAFVALALPAMADAPQNAPSLTLFAVGVPTVGLSAGQFCTMVAVGNTAMVVPNSDANGNPNAAAAAFLIALSAAEARGQTIHAYVPAKDADTTCGTPLAPNSSGVQLPHLVAYK